MELKQLLLISLVALPLFSCNGSKEPDDPVIDYTVTEDEFNHALSWEDAEYVQMDIKSIDYKSSGEKYENEGSQKYAPNAFLKSNKSEDNYKETRVFRSKKTINEDEYIYEGFTRDKKIESEWVKMEEIEAEVCFNTPKDDNLLENLKKYNVDYSSFALTSDNFYFARYNFLTPDEKTRYVDVYLRFENKVFTRFNQIAYSDASYSKKTGESAADITYKKEEIPKPGTFDPTVSKEEFDKALQFDTEYLQLNEERSRNNGDDPIIRKYAPNAHERVYEKDNRDVRVFKKGENEYAGYERTLYKSWYTFSYGSLVYKTIADYSKEVLDTLQQYNFDNFDNYTYGDDNEYHAKSSGDDTISLAFEDKQLVKKSIKYNSGLTVTDYYTYDEVEIIEPQI